MRIRKQPRQLPASRDSFLACSFREGVGREHSEVGHGGPAVSLVAAMAGKKGMESHGVVEPAPGAIDHMLMAGHLQSGGGGNGNVRELSQQLAGGTSRQSGTAPERGLVDMEIAASNGHQRKLLPPANHLESRFHQDDDDYDVDGDDDDDDSLTRHYVRRGLRSNGDGVTLNQSEENVPVEDVIAGIPKTKSYECDRFPYSEKMANRLVSPGATRNRCIIRSAIPCNSNEDDDHPSREPEGSLLHSLYLQLLAAGREGISLRSLFTSFESQTSLPRLANNWREQVKAHLKSGPYFEEVKGRYLLCEFLVQPSRRNTKRKGSSESLGVQTRRKAYQKTYEAVLCESAMEFQKLQQQKVNGGGSETPSPSMLRSESTESDDLDNMTHPTPTRSISAPLRLPKSRKPISDDDGLQMARNVRFGGAIPGSLKAMQARIIAETGVQEGVRCARKDGSNDSSKWQCPMMAMEGHTLCEHHSFLNERKRARYAKARRHGDASTIRKSPPSRLQEKSAAPTTYLKPSIQHDVQSPSAPGSELDKSDSDDLAGLDEVASQALLTMKSDILAVTSFHQCLEKPLYLADTNPVEVEHRSMAPVVNEEAPRAKSNPAPQFFARSATGRFIAAKKTAVKIPSLSLNETDTSLEKPNVPSTRPPSIPPLPAFYGPRRKTVKNRSLLSIS